MKIDLEWAVVGLVCDVCIVAYRHAVHASSKQNIAIRLLSATCPVPGASSYGCPHNYVSTGTLGQNLSAVLT